MILECGNLDSCEPGAEHWFPDVDEPVRIKRDIHLRIVGTDDYLAFTKGQEVYVGDAFIIEAHQVGISSIPDSVQAWADVDDDIEPLTRDA